MIAKVRRFATSAAWLVMGNRLTGDRKRGDMIPELTRQAKVSAHDKRRAPNGGLVIVHQLLADMQHLEAKVQGNATSRAGISEPTIAHRVTPGRLQLQI